MTPTLTTGLIRPFLNLFSANVPLLMFSGLCQSHSILHPQRVSKLNDNFDILFQTRVKMYLVRSLNWPLLYSSTMTACRLNASIFALSRSGTGTGGGDIEPGIVVVVFLIKRDATYSLCRRSGLNPSSLVSGIFSHEPSSVSFICRGMIVPLIFVWGFGGF